MNIEEIGSIIRREAAYIDVIKQEIGKSVVGQSKLVDRLIIALLSRGHILLEGVPGLAKTLSVTSLAQVTKLNFGRIQFTPDLLPADIIGTMFFNQKNSEFEVRKGPIFANLILADEINRAPAKVQSALLEAMQEKQVTIGENSFRLPEPFMVLATQNPLEQEGTYPLSEAQTDRFMLKTIVDYPTKNEEAEILRQALLINKQKPEAKISPEDLQRLRTAADIVYIDEKIEKYIVDIIRCTRTPEEFGIGKIKPFISFGCSPRATIFLAKAAKARAFVERRAYVVPEDIRDLAFDVMRHRIGVSWLGNSEAFTADRLTAECLNAVKVP